MNRDEIIRMARDAGFESHDIKLNFPKELERFANLVAAAEREACAKVCEFETDASRDGVNLRITYAGKKVAAAIRARGEQ